MIDAWMAGTSDELLRVCPDLAKPSAKTSRLAGCIDGSAVRTHKSAGTLCTKDRVFALAAGPMTSVASEGHPEPYQSEEVHTTVTRF